jgi:hypothetical protein
MAKKRAEVKTTAHGVKCEYTKALFKQLKDRDFTRSLEKGSSDTWKIKANICGVHFILSATKKGMLYQKEYARNQRKWQEFQHIDELIRMSLVKQDSMPTEKQKKYINLLLEQHNALTMDRIKIKTCNTVVEACETISMLKSKINQLELQ